MKGWITSGANNKLMCPCSVREPRRNMKLFENFGLNHFWFEVSDRIWFVFFLYKTQYLCFGKLCSIPLCSAVSITPSGYVVTLTCRIKLSCKLFHMALCCLSVKTVLPNMDASDDCIILRCYHFSKCIIIRSYLAFQHHQKKGSWTAVLIQILWGQ